MIDGRVDTWLLILFLFSSFFFFFFFVYSVTVFYSFFFCLGFTFFSSLFSFRSLAVSAARRCGNGGGQICGYYKTQDTQHPQLMNRSVATWCLRHINFGHDIGGWGVK